MTERACGDRQPRARTHCVQRQPNATCLTPCSSAQFRGEWTEGLKGSRWLCLSYSVPRLKLGSGRGSDIADLGRDPEGRWEAVLESLWQRGIDKAGPIKRRWIVFGARAAWSTGCPFPSRFWQFTNHATALRLTRFGRTRAIIFAWEFRRPISDSCHTPWWQSIHQTATTSMTASIFNC